MNTGLIAFTVLASLLLVFSLAKRKLSLAGAVCAALLSVIIFTGTDFPGIALLGTFFILGIAATNWNRATSGMAFISEKQQRDALQVLANGGLAAILALIAYLFPDYNSILLLMIACAFSSATADTVSSELGNLYGKYFYNILNLQKDIRGENGVISFEGTLAGIVGSIIVALVYGVFVQFDLILCSVIIAAGTLGNLADSILGATLERRNIIGNNAVNFLNTFIAAAFGGMLSY